MIYRESVTVTDYQELALNGQRIISVAPDRNGRSDVFDLWYETGMPGTSAIWVFGTGHPVPWSNYTRHAWRFVGTVVTPSGLVWHVYTGPLHGEAIGV